MSLSSVSRRLGPPGRLFFATVRRRAPSATDTLVTRPAFSTPSELQTRTEYSTIHRTQTHRTEGRSFESTRYPLSGSPLFPHIPCVESTNHIRTSPSRLMMCTAARPSHPDRAAELRSCGAARRMPLACLYASAGRLGQPPPPAASATASRLLPGAQHGAFCLALSTAPSAWLELRPLPRARHGAQQSRRKR